MWEELRLRLAGKHAVVLGVGNPLRGDDALGPILADRLRGRVQATVINAGDVPENYLGLVAAEHPEVIVIVDAAELGGEPGSIALIEMEQIEGGTFSTHSANLAMLAQVLQADTQADIFMLGIQPRSAEYGAPITLPIQTTLGLLEELFVHCWPTAGIGSS